MLFPYKDADSRIHRLDARPKMVFVAVMFVLSILLSDILYLSVLLAIVLMVAAVGKILRPTLGLLKFVAFIAIFVFVFNLFLSTGSSVLFEWGPIVVTEESMLFALSMSLRLFLAVGAFSLLTLAVHPDEALGILSRFGYKTMTGLSLSTRMYPTIAADSRNIMDSMRSRGVEFDEGNFVQKTKARAPVLMPLLLNSLDRSIGIAEAMEARGFGSGKRTIYNETSMTTRERLMIVSFLAAMVFGVVTFILGWGGGDYLSDPSLTYGLSDILILSVYAFLLSTIVMGGGE